jgi:hypothetical protein
MQRAEKMLFGQALHPLARSVILRDVSQEEDYDDLDAARAPSLKEAMASARTTLIGVGVFLLFICVFASFVTVVPGPGVELWRTIIALGSLAGSAAAFIPARVVTPRRDR